VRALTIHGPKDIRCTDVPDAALPDGLGAVVKVRLAGICGSDLHIYGGHGFSDDTGYTVGHEAVGEVVEVGDQVRRFRVGDSVLIPASVGCALCATCATGRVSTCEHRGQPWRQYCYGMSHALEGSQAEAVAVPHADVNLVTIPDEVGDEAALLLTDNAPTAWYGARRARIAPGDTVTVVGLGPVGLLAVQSAFAMGAARVLAVDPVAHRRERAVSMGAEPVEADDPKTRIRELTCGLGTDAVVEAVGADETISLAISAARVGGRVSVVGVSQNRAFPFRMDTAQVRELEFSIGLCSAQYELPALLALTAAGRLDPASLVTHRLDLEGGPGGYELLSERVDGVVKVVIDGR
jgi:threonine dehydrogenase-like Zn-dependent dehydrogenase